MIRLVEAAYKYEHREPRDQDLRELEQLRALNSQLKSEIDKAKVSDYSIRTPFSKARLSFLINLTLYLSLMHNYE